jgi:hypothetical protein
MERNMIMRQVESLILLRENMESPHDHEWNAFLKVLDENFQRLDKIKIFVRTPGGGPTPAQANKLRPILKNRPVLVSVVSESLVVRFLGSSMALLNRELKMFSESEIEEACKHLKLSPYERSLVEDNLDEMLFELYPP